MSRRGLLKALALSGVALPIHLAGCGSGSGSASSCAGATSCDPYAALPPHSPAGDTVVGMAGGSDVARMTADAIASAGGLNEIAQGETVLIKPNIVVPNSGEDLPVVTNGQVLGAVIDAVVARTPPSCVYVGDASADIPEVTRTEDVAGTWGILDLCAGKRVNFLSLKEHGFDSKTHADWEALAGWQVPVSKLLYGVKHVINVPVLKNHQGVTWSNCNYSCCIKNMLGVTDSAWRANGAAPYGLGAVHDEHLADNVAELHMVLPPILMNVVDATRVIVQGGPAGSAKALTVASPGLVLAGKDVVATDSAALAVLRCHGKRLGVAFSTPSMDYTRGSVWENPQIVRAVHHGLGRVNLDRYGLHQVTIDDNGSVASFDQILAEWA